jgi:hypothetical protein
MITGVGTFIINFAGPASSQAGGDQPWSGSTSTKRRGGSIADRSRAPSAVAVTTASAAGFGA